MQKPHWPESAQSQVVNTLLLLPASYTTHILLEDNINKPKSVKMLIKIYKNKHWTHALLNCKKMKQTSPIFGCVISSFLWNKLSYESDAQVFCKFCCGGNVLTAFRYISIFYTCPLSLCLRFVYQVANMKPIGDNLYGSLMLWDKKIGRFCVQWAL